MLADGREPYAVHMVRPAGWAPLAILVAFAVGCAADRAPRPAPPSPPPPATSPAAGAASVVPASATPVRLDLRATRLTIPSLGIDVEVQGSRIVPADGTPVPGCPPPPPGGTTFTVPDQGVTTPVDAVEGLENKAWLFGHSRWLGEPGVLFRLQDLNVGDELFVEGIDRATGRPVARQRFTVSALYLADIDSGGTLVTAPSAAEVPPRPVVVLQTSAREDGAGKPWILDQRKVTAKSRNVVDGDLNDPCKYLLLFVFAQAS